ncbi:DUF1659 domain-containing protein [Acidaminococcus sp. AM05-11]|uniref:DUF1659 domain-containing protein n=1 Tax=Acidaminococcus sp. AM05-11 TaxID=2291997 RepID=UPI000E507D9F|nr:DUF1659 domain-containing protein [Acidaminococcus sp. AM05-11]RHK00591.1 DUF1659 domain-containing protein [Acidaminococcus sp. AM05-11]
MDIEKNLVDSVLELKIQSGEDAEGNPVFVYQEFDHLAEGITLDQVFETGQVLAGLMDPTPEIVSRERYVLIQPQA